MPERPRPSAPAPPVEVVAERLARLRARIADAGRDPAALRVVAVTKGFDVSAVEAARAVGLHHIGENYATELLDKAAAWAARRGPGPPPAPAPSRGSDTAAAGADPVAGADGAPCWHYIGAVQRRRVGRLAPVVSWWETVSRPEEGEAIAARAPGATVLVEVNTTDMRGRNGVAPAALAPLVLALRATGLDVRGLMTVAPPGGPERARRAFALTARLAADLGLRELSMGMSDDLEAALAEGSTMVRVGRALFGDRPPTRG